MPPISVLQGRLSSDGVAGFSADALSAPRVEVALVRNVTASVREFAFGGLQSLPAAMFCVLRKTAAHFAAVHGFGEFGGRDSDGEDTQY